MRRWWRCALDARMAVVTLTHDPKLDDPAIRTALRAPVFYLGCLAHPHPCQARGAAARGVQRDRDRPHPCAGGLAIGAKSPAEIAVSIMAQITERLRKG